jgi:hypothetical protein
VERILEHMYEPGSSHTLPGDDTSTTADVAAFIDGLAQLNTTMDDADRITLLGQLETVKAAAAAAQARLSVSFDASQRAQQRTDGVPARRLGRGIAEQVALARRESPSRGSRHLGLAKALVHEMPHTLTALACGDITEWQATLIVKATAILEVEDRAEVDTRLAGRLGPLGDRQVDAQARALAYELDPRAVVNARARAESERRVSLRPAPDCMTYLTGLVPMVAGIAAWKALDEHARRLRAAGDDRSLDQIKADTFIERLTGQQSAAATPVSVNLIITDTALFAGGNDTATLEGLGPIPALVARDLIAALPENEQIAIRRLFTDPATGSVSDIDSRQRYFTGQLRHLITTRDQICRTPWCDAPIRHIDHVQAHGNGGATSADNGQGLCERCNEAKQAPGWNSEAAKDPDQPHTVTTTTPTGHTYHSTAPPLLL